MYIITVIPIQKNLQNEHLSYFSSIDINLGTIVEVQIRKKNEDAIVIDVKEVKDVKTDIKNADFQLKKIVKVKGLSPFDKYFFDACNKMKDYYVSNTGSIIKTLFPKVFLENIKNLNISNNKNIDNNPNIKNEKLIFQADFSDRLAFYRTLIREAFAKKESIFICVPNRHAIENFASELSRGIEKYVFIFHSDLSKKNLINSYNDLIKETHPVLIIGTGIFMSIPKSNIKTIIIENESSEIYKQINRPFIDIRNFAEVFTSIKKIKLIFGDTLLRPETLHRHDNREFGEVSSPIYRISPVENQNIIDMKDEIDNRGKKSFQIISSAVKKIIDDSISNRESAFLFTARKGLAPITVCNDCGNTLLCPSCSTPIVLYGSKQISANKATTQRVFMCNKCGLKENTEVSCPVCSSWNLTPIGIGADRVFEEVKNLYTKVRIIQIDKETTPTIKEAKNAINEFNRNKGSILIGTEMAFSYITNKINSSAIISLDGLFSIPNFNITQKIIHIIEKLYNLTEKHIVIQTRVPDSKVLQCILNGNVLPLFREELQERKDFGYPPFKRLIKITFEGSKKDTERARTFINNILSEYDPQIFSAFISKIKGNFITNTVIKIDPRIWPLPLSDSSFLSKDLLDSLRKLPPSFAIDVDPDDLL